MITQGGGDPVVTLHRPHPVAVAHISIIMISGSIRSSNSSNIKSV
jgi:hypothetical protein